MHLTSVIKDRELWGGEAPGGCYLSAKGRSTNVQFNSIELDHKINNLAHNFATKLTKIKRIA